MSVARTGALPNTYKYFTIAVNGFEQKRLDGLVSHESRTGTAAFHNITQLAHIFNDVFDRIHYPMNTVNPRLFNRKSLKTSVAQPVEFSGPAEGASLRGKLATFRIHVQYRYYATWQGNITCLECGTTYTFDSFLQLMKVFDRVLGDGGTGAAPHGKQMCEVAVQNYRNFILSGNVSHPAVEERMEFANEFELMEQMEAMFAPAGHSDNETVIMPRKPGACKGSTGTVTFVVRLLFDSNATWQGTIHWKERGEQESFRSFLEMLMMMDEAAGRSIGREGDNACGAAENAS